ncbi:MAG: hypothetical protein ACYDH6_14980 [Acidimicrobiales bacterium]
MLVDTMDLSADDFGEATGWQIKLEGACKGDVCVPLPAGTFSAASAAERLGMAVVNEPSAGLWALGPATMGGRALTSVDTSDFALPDLDGHEFRLASLHGQKVVLVAWAPY